MSIRHLIFRNLKKNGSNYYLYVFALIFSAALYFAFVTLQYDPSMDPAKGSIKGSAAMKTAGVLLVAIVSVFLLYANTLFIKRRSQEIGLYQLIGMTKNRIFLILSVENMILYFLAVLIGILTGLLFSKLILMILFKITGVNAIASLHFSWKPFTQTSIVFLVIYLLIMLMNYVFIKRQTILSLFRAHAKTENKVKRTSFIDITIGVFGILLIAAGYYTSTLLFSSDFITGNNLVYTMLFILGSVIIGTYFFYKGSVTFIFNIIRKQKNGYLSINEVLSLSSIMFRMKSNSVLLTVITTVSALSIGLLSLSYISYYSAEKTANINVPEDYALLDDRGASFEKELKQADIGYTKTVINTLGLRVDYSKIVESNSESIMGSTKDSYMAVVSDAEVDGVELEPGEALFSGNRGPLEKIEKLKDSGIITVKSGNKAINLKYLGIEERSVLPSSITGGYSPVLIIDETQFAALKKGQTPVAQKNDNSLYTGISITDRNQLKTAEKLFMKENSAKETNIYERKSKLQEETELKMTVGLTMFIVGFLGLAFLITSGCILYFKQMDESEGEKDSYTILRKLGFTEGDLLKGIQFKQLFNFGIPLAVGLLHSFFAVKSGWFFFGTEIWTPMIMVMILYTILYSIFAVLSILHYKTVIKSAL